MKFQETNGILNVKGAAEYLRCLKSHLSDILAGKVPNVPPTRHVFCRKEEVHSAAGLGGQQ